MATPHTPVIDGLLYSIDPDTGQSLMWVYDVEADEGRQVSVADAFAGMLAYGKSLGEPSPAAYVAISRAMAFGRTWGLV